MPVTYPVTLVVVEDDLSHARLLEKCLRRAHITNEILTIRDGQEAVDYLFGDNTCTEAHHDLPLLVLLDLNLPGLDGV